MSLSAIGGFAQGLGAGLQMRNDRKAAAEEGARMDRYLDLIEKNPELAGSGMSMPAEAPLNGGKFEGFGVTPRLYANGGGGGGGGLFDLTKKHEGGGDPNALFGFSNRGGAFDGVRVSEMTIGDLASFASPSGKYGQWVKSKVGRIATPMGKHQIVGTTLQSAAREMGLSPDTKFTEGTQDSIADFLARRRLAGANSPAAKRAALRAEWEGFKGVPDDALDLAIGQFEANGGMSRPRPMGAMRPE